MAAYSFIDNINDFFSTGYFTEDFQKKVFDKSGLFAGRHQGTLFSLFCTSSAIQSL